MLRIGVIGGYRPLSSVRSSGMNTETNARRAYVEAIMNRLRRHYAERAVIPGGEDGEEGQTLSLQMLQRLYRHVMSEGYGE